MRRRPRISPRSTMHSDARSAKYTLFHNLDLRLDPACAGWMTGKLADISENKGYFQFTDGRPWISSRYCSSSMPCRRPPWPPKAWPLGSDDRAFRERQEPAQDRSAQVQPQDPLYHLRLLEADGEVWDEEGNLAAISRQIAQFRKE